MKGNIDDIVNSIKEILDPDNIGAPIPQSDIEKIIQRFGPESSAKSIENKEVETTKKTPIPDSEINIKHQNNFNSDGVKVIKNALEDVPTMDNSKVLGVSENIQSLWNSDETLWTNDDYKRFVHLMKKIITPFITSWMQDNMKKIVKEEVQKELRKIKSIQQDLDTI